MRKPLHNQRTLPLQEGLPDEEQTPGFSKLPVRLNVWARGGENRCTVLVRGKWESCFNLAAARSRARNLGYTGIAVKCV